VRPQRSNERSLAVRSYRLLLHLFPRSFREQYADEMTRLYADRRQETEGRPGARVWLAVTAGADVLAHAGAERARVTLVALMGIFREVGTMEGWTRDLRLGARALRRRPGFSATATITLALGIGATVAIFSVVHAVLLEPLPYPTADRLVVLWQVDRETGARSRGVDHPDVRYWQEQVEGLRVAGFSGGRATLTDMGEPESLQTAHVTDGLLDLFGLQPALGRDLRGEDDVAGGPNVVVVAHDFWRSRLGGSPDVIGRTLTLQGEAWEVVGVAPEGFDFPGGVTIWRPRQHVFDDCGHGCRIMNAIGRIEESSTLEQVQDRMDAASDRLSSEFVDTHRDVTTRFEPLLDTQVADVRTALWVLMGSVAIVLLIACANVANLLLVRSADRRGEIALRSMLCAPRGRIVRQLLTESLLLALGGGVFGVALAGWGVSLMVRLAPGGIPRLEEAGLDGAVIGFTLLVVLAVTAAFGLVPALRVSGRSHLASADGGRRTVGARGSGLSRSLLLSGEVALSLVLLLGAGLLFGTLRSIGAQDLGFATERVERFRLSLPDARYDTEAALRFYDELEQRLIALPGVEAAGSAFGVPLGSGRIHTSASLLDRPPVDPADLPSLSLRPASEGYREAMGLPLVRGRWFDDQDARDAEGVAVINQAAADEHYPGVDPIGRRLRMDVTWGFDDEPERTIVGIVGNARSFSATEPDDPTVYVPNAQMGVEVLYVTMRLAPGARSALPAARAVLADMDPALAPTNTERIEDVVAEQLAPTRFYLTLIGSFSLLALVLAAVGLYGVVAYAVSRRTREIGIRVALGARRDTVVGMVVREGLAPAVIGVVVGLAAALLGGRALSSLLYGVEPQDPVTLVSVTAILMGVVFIATLVPARRASGVAPTEALRAD
jgi:putative ABC transport system permease protein